QLLLFASRFGGGRRVDRRCVGRSATRAIPGGPAPMTPAAKAATKKAPAKKPPAKKAATKKATTKKAPAKKAATRKAAAATPERVKGPASYFPSIERTYGRPI